MIQLIVLKIKYEKYQNHGQNVPARSTIKTKTTD